MTEAGIFSFDGPDEAWGLTLVNSETTDRVFGRFVMNALGITLWFQTTDDKVYFISGIVSAQRLTPVNKLDRKEAPYAETLPNLSENQPFGDPMGNV